MIGSLGTIFMLHRVAPYAQTQVVHNENLKVSPKELESVIQWLVKDKRDFISLDELTRRLASGERPRRKFAIFTLDDGYRDNLELAYPLFKKYNVPFTVYVTNSFPNRTTTLWWYALERFMEQNPQLSLPDGTVKDNTQAAQKNRNFLYYRQQILDRHFKDPLGYLKGAGQLDFDLEAEISDKCMTWDEICQLATDNLVTIGAHTVNHYPLSRLSADEVVHEIADSKQELEQKLGQTMRHFAFPFGGRHEAGAREYALARQVGFDTVTTTWQGHIAAGADPHTLNRVFLFPLERNGYTLGKLLYRNPVIYVTMVRKLLQSIRG